MTKDEDFPSLGKKMQEPSLSPRTPSVSRCNFQARHQLDVAITACEVVVEVEVRQPEGNIATPESFGVSRDRVRRRK